MKTKIFIITIFLVISALFVSFLLTPALASSDSQVIFVSEQEESSESDYVEPIQEQNEEYENNEENENLNNRDNYNWREEVEVFGEDENAQTDSDEVSEDEEAEEK